MQAVSPKRIGAGARRRVRTVFGAAAITALVAGVAVAGAVPTEVCNPTPKAVSSYCGTFQRSLSTTVAGRAFAVDLHVEDSSAQFGTNKDVWTSVANVSIAGPGATKPILTPSADLPDGLRVSGGGPCTGPAFSDCAAGHGSFIVDVSGTGGFFDGFHSGTFGVDRVTNVADTGDTNDIHYVADLRLCMQNGSNACFPGEISSTADIHAPQPDAGGDVQAAVPMRLQTSYNYGFGTANLDVGVQSVDLHLDATSQTLANGTSANRRYALTALPGSCGPVATSTVFTAVDVRQVIVPDAFSITGCTEMLVKANPTGEKVKVSGTVSGVDTDKVKIELLKKKGDDYKPVEQTSASPDADGDFKAKLPQPKEGKCEVKASFAGDAEHLASSDIDKFRC